RYYREKARKCRLPLNCRRHSGQTVEAPSCRFLAARRAALLIRFSAFSLSVRFPYQFGAARSRRRDCAALTTVVATKRFRAAIPQAKHRLQLPSAAGRDLRGTAVTRLALANRPSAWRQPHQPVACLREDANLTYSNHAGFS